MKDTSRETERNGQQRPDEQAVEPSQDHPAVSYTPEQRRLIRKGLRIWAKVAVRSYMRKHGAAPSRAEAAEEGGEEEGR